MVLCVIATLIATYVFTINQTEIYEATATYVMRPRASLVADQQDSVRVLDTLGRQVSIGSTYVQVASSRQIRQKAMESLGLSADQRRGLSVSGQVVAGTNILKITVEGPDPTILDNFANQIGVETVKYVSNLYEIFELEPLDGAVPPRDPIRPNLVVNMILGVVLGLSLGTGIGLFNYYWQAPLKKTRHLDIIDQMTGAYTLAYFRLRLRQEVSRARRKGESFSVALIRLPVPNAAPSTEILQQTAAYLQAWGRDEDILAYAGEATFALLLIDVVGETAKEQVERLCLRLRTDVLSRADGLNLWNTKCSAGISSFVDATADADDLWDQSVLALTDVKLANEERVLLYSPEGLLASSRPVS